MTRPRFCATASESVSIDTAHDTEHNNMVALKEYLRA
jgi:hypothetical protein